MPSPSRFDDDELQRIRSRLDGLTRRRLKGHAEDRPRRQAAVLVSLCQVEGAPSVLFTKRSDRVGTHKGQVSFPGGMADEEDTGPEDTALREMAEEIGVPPDQVAVLGRFHEAQAITGVKVIPVVGFLGEVSVRSLVVSEAEIDHVFTLTFDELLDEHQRYERVLGDRGPHPVFVAGPHPVWGLTAWILREVLEDVFDVQLGPGRAPVPTDRWP